VIGFWRRKLQASAPQQKDKGEGILEPIIMEKFKAFLPSHFRFDFIADSWKLVEGKL